MTDSLGKRHDELQREEAMRLNLHHFYECLQAGMADQEIAEEFDVHLETIYRMRREADLSSFQPYVTIGKKKNF